MTRQLDILLIEDTKNDAFLTMRFLQKCYPSLNCLHLENGEKTIEFLNTFLMSENKGESWLPKIILLDFNLPKISGLQVLKAIRENEATRLAPVIILTSSADSTDIKASYNGGANGYVVKPVDYHVFKKTISQIGDFWLNLNQLPA